MQASVSAMVGNRLTLLLDDDLNQVESAAQRLRELLPQLLVDKFVEAFPMVLDVDDFERALQVGLRRNGAAAIRGIRCPGDKQQHTCLKQCCRLGWHGNICLFKKGWGEKCMNLRVQRQLMPLGADLIELLC